MTHAMRDSGSPYLSITFLRSQHDRDRVVALERCAVDRERADKPWRRSEDLDQRHDLGLGDGEVIARTVLSQPTSILTQSSMRVASRM